MTKEQAFAKAARHSARTHGERFVIFESGEFETATEGDLCDYWLGAEVVGYFADGELQEE